MKTLSRFTTARSIVAALVAVAVSLSLAPTTAFAQTLGVASPNGGVDAKIRVDAQGAKFDLAFNGATILKDSRLGMTFKDAKLGDLQIIGAISSSRDETWTNKFGKCETQIDRCSELTLKLREKDGAKRGYDLVFRVYDDAFAFRYVLTEDGGLAKEGEPVTILSDDSVFNFGDPNLEAWAAFYPKYNTSQEEMFHKVKLSEIKTDAFVGSPVIVQGANWRAAITEADLIDWSGAQFAAADGLDGALKIRLTPRDDGQGAVVRKAPASSPWRVVLLGETAIDIVNASTEILNLATPCQIDDVSWIKPGNAAWDWWAPKSRKVTNEFYYEFIDFASKMGWEYLLVDAGWARDAKFGTNATDEELCVPGIDMPKLVAYARERNVDVLLWAHYSWARKEGERKLMERCVKWGVKGLKIDFMDSHSQEMVAWTTETCKIAAELRLLIDYHGMYKPTGFERTYPNQITREGVRGNEYNRWHIQTATHTATLPFTRCMLGPADYTPGGFLNKHKDEFVSLEKNKEPGATCQVVGTRAHELALCMIYDSPLRCYCDLPKNYEGEPGLEYLRALPTVWKKTKALEGEIGEYYVVERESFDGDFYVSAITNETARKVELKLDFLPKDKELEVALYVDAEASAETATAIQIDAKTVRQNDVLTIDMAPEGGWNAVFRAK